MIPIQSLLVESHGQSISFPWESFIRQFINCNFSNKAKNIQYIFSFTHQWLSMYQLNHEQETDQIKEINA